MSKHDETKTDESAWKIISCTKIRAYTSKTIGKNVDDISLIFIRFFLSQTIQVFKFNPVFIGILDLLYFLFNIKRQRVVKPPEFGFKSLSLIFKNTFLRRSSCSCKTRNTAGLISPQFTYLFTFWLLISTHL